MLTLQMLKDMPPGTMFATGTIVDAPEGINLANTGLMLRWVAIRGDYHDWTIYAHMGSYSTEWIRAHGDKVGAEDNIKKLVPCKDEAFEMYRH